MEKLDSLVRMEVFVNMLLRKKEDIIGCSNSDEGSDKDDDESIVDADSESELAEYDEDDETSQNVKWMLNQKMMLKMK